MQEVFVPLAMKFHCKPTDFEDIEIYKLQTVIDSVIYHEKRIKRLAEEEAKKNKKK